MKARLLAACIACVCLLLTNKNVLAQSNVEERCHTKERGGCPFKIGDIYVLDRCTGSNPLDPQRTSIGNTLCDAFNNADIIADNLKKGAAKFMNDAEGEFKKRMNPLFKDAIDPQALAEFNEAVKFYNEIYADISSMIKDENCGLNQMKNIQKFFNEQLSNLTAIKGIIESGFKVISTDVPPALNEIKNFSSQIGNAIQIASQQGQKGADELKKLQEALNTLTQQMEAIQKFDVAGLINTTVDMSVRVGGLYGKCASCATSISVTIGEMGKSVTQAGAATATPESWVAAGGSAWLYPLAGVDAAVAAAGSLVSSGACALMVEEVAKIQENITALKNYYAKVNQFALTISKSVTLMEDAADNLNKLVASASKDLKPVVSNMSKSLASLDKYVDRIFESVNRNILPKVQNLTIAVTKQVASNADHLYDCYMQYTDLVERVTAETLAGIREMFEAGTKIVDAAKIMDNMGRGFNSAMAAAKNTANSNLTNVKNSFSRLEDNLCISRKSNGELDIAQTADCIKNKILKNGPAAYLEDAKRILDNANDLVSSITQLVINAAKAGDDAYTNKPSAADKARAIAKSREAKDIAIAAKAKIKKSTKKDFAVNQAKEEAKRKMKERLEKVKAEKDEAPDPRIKERKKLTLVNSSL